MTRYVVDASVAVKWFVPESEHESALALLDASHSLSVDLAAPDLIVAEVGSALTNKVSTGEITCEEASEMVSVFLSSPMTLVASSSLAFRALEIVRAATTTFYDSLYVAAAEMLPAQLVTADEQLVRLVAATPFSRFVLRLSDVAA